MSFLGGWFTSAPSQPLPPPPQPPSPPSISISISDDHDNDGPNPDDLDDDRPPAFPSLQSIQRSSSKPLASIDALLDADSKAMPPPSLPPPRSANSSSGSAGLATPLTTTKRMPNVNTKKKARDKVALAPGHSALDWGRLKSSGEDLRSGVTSLLRITAAELKEHNTPEDAWSAFGGKVYNITPYLPFHPGGQKELMRVAGRDGTKLFALTHSWVNLDFMLDGCMVGFLVPDRS